jgi:ribosomal protein S10
VLEKVGKVSYTPRDKQIKHVISIKTSHRKLARSCSKLIPLPTHVTSWLTPRLAHIARTAGRIEPTHFLILPYWLHFSRYKFTHSSYQSSRFKVQGYKRLIKLEHFLYSSHAHAWAMVMDSFFFNR